MDRRSRIEAAIEAQERLRGAVADEIVDAAISALRAQLGDATDAEPQRKTVTILFADVAGFTAWGETADVEVVGDAMDALWQRLDRIVTDHHGRVDKHIGDSVMAVWGATTAREDDPENAIRAALAMRETVASQEFANLARLGLQLRIGVNTGPVIVREVGTQGEYTALGDAVNVASRLEGAAPPGEILVGHDTYRHVRGIFSVAEQAPLEVKGKRDPLQTYLVTGVRPRAFRLENRGVEGVETRMVGRSAELNTLRRSLTGAEESRTPRLVTVAGDAGLGKSRLLYEFIAWLQLQPEEVYLLQGRADSQRETTPYALFKDVLFFRFEIPWDAPVDRAVAVLTNGFDSYGALGEEVAHRAAHLIGIDMSTSPHVAEILTDPERLRDAGEDAIRRLVEEMAADSPVVMLLEDLHWADHASLGLIERIANQVDGPLLVVATARPTLFDEAPQWGAGGDRIEVTPLGEDAAAEQARDVLRNVARIPVGFVEKIVDAAAGNPFYVEELVKSLIETGVIRIEDDAWEIDLDAAPTLVAPPSLVALLQARLDRLTPGERAALQPAAVVGQVFWDAAVFAAAGDGASADDLARLVRRELVMPHPDSAFGGTAEYAFKNALLRDVVYEQVLRTRRRQYHRAVAQWLAGRGDQDAWAGVIAGHYDAAGDGEASRWHARAGMQAMLRFANDDALASFSRSLELDDLDEDSRFAALDGSGEVLMRLARYEEAVAAHRRALAAAEVFGNVRARARALTGILFAGARIRSTEDLAGIAEDAVATVRAMPEPDQELLCEALRGAGWVAMRAGDLAAAKSSAEEAAVAARLAGDRRGLSLSLNLLGLAESALGNVAAAERHMNEALALDRELGNRREECVSRLNLGELARLRGDFETAASHYRQALEIAREVGDRDTEALAQSNLGGAYAGMGRHELAIEALLTSLAAFEAAGRRELLSETKRFLAEAHLVAGEAEAAAQWAADALVDGRVAGNPEQVGHAWRVLGLAAAALRRPVALRGGESVGADECFARSTEAFAGADIDRAVALADWARWKSATDPAGATALWAESIALLRPKGLEHLAGAFDAAKE